MGDYDYLIEFRFKLLRQFDDMNLDTTQKGIREVRDECKVDGVVRLHG
jgi:hypothetical protein